MNRLASRFNHTFRSVHSLIRQFIPMSLTESFNQAVAESKQLTKRPDNATLLRLYSLYKQATEGDAPAECDAGMFDFVRMI